MKYLYFIILAVMLFSCNNWDKNPVKVEETERAVSGLIYKSNFPNNTSDFYAFKDDLWILGTNDGGFYKSTDKGNSWTKKGEMKEKDKINSITAFTAKMNSVSKTFVLIGTDKGIYLSIDNGEIWKESIIYSSETGNYVQAYFFSSSYNSALDKLTINAYGWDGSNSLFTSSDEGGSWTGTKNHEGKHTASLYIKYTWKERTNIGTMMDMYASASYESLSGPVRSKLCKLSDRYNDYIVSSGDVMNCLIGGNDGYSYAATKNGLYRSFVSTANKWSLISFQNQDVKSLCRITDNVFYACTDSGLFYSVDQGFDWMKMLLTVDNPKMVKVLSYNKIVYFITEDDGVYYAELPDFSGGSVFTPVLLEPEDKSEKQFTDIRFLWDSYNKKNFENYILQISEADNFKDETTETIYIVSNLYYQKKDMKKNVKYFWRLRAYNLYGATDWTTSYSFTIK